jgi:hypothetical protein
MLHVPARRRARHPRPRPDVRVAAALARMRLAIGRRYRPRSYGGNRRYQGFQFVDALQRVGAAGSGRSNTWRAL